MRTAEQTSDELVEKMSIDWDMCKGQNIQCAINAIDYTIKCLQDSFSNAPHFDDEIEFQQQVKQELETRLK